MNCIFICVFNQEQYVDMLFLLLESINIHGNTDIWNLEKENENRLFSILIYTSTEFMNIIKKSDLCGYC